MPPETHLYLIRHGEATYAADDTAASLTPLGIVQCERLRDRLTATREIKPDVVIASTMRRAAATAEIVAPAFGLPILMDDGVEEIRPGSVRGVPGPERARRWGPRPDWLADPRAPWAPGAENPAAFTDRVCAALARLTREHAGRTMVVFCHGGVIRSSFAFFQGLDALACIWPGPGLVPYPEHAGLIGRPWLASHAPANTSITHWHLEPQHRLSKRPSWILHTFNDAFHLRDIGSDERINWSAASFREPKDLTQPESPERAAAAVPASGGIPEDGIA